ncbi:hypothetical protein [Lachnoclostridium sp. An14]|uniref:hypothetical protein n=1 Tax=Lachnoclostridium sp. An14 TaxID=1965562 RepID=UPI0013A60CB2|nr:hypothetical protein [Lachnoclostridium sp. An14]
MENADFYDTKGPFPYNKKTPQGTAKTHRKYVPAGKASKSNNPVNFYKLIVKV